MQKTENKNVNNNKHSPSLLKMSKEISNHFAYGVDNWDKFSRYEKFIYANQVFVRAIYATSKLAFFDTDNIYSMFLYYSRASGATSQREDNKMLVAFNLSFVLNKDTNPFKLYNVAFHELSHVTDRIYLKKFVDLKDKLSNLFPTLNKNSEDNDELDENNTEGNNESDIEDPIDRENREISEKKAMIYNTKWGWLASGKETLADFRAIKRTSLVIAGGVLKTKGEIVKPLDLLKYMAKGGIKMLSHLVAPAVIFYQDIFNKIPKLENRFNDKTYYISLRFIKNIADKNPELFYVKNYDNEENSIEENQKNDSNLKNGKCSLNENDKDAIRAIRKEFSFKQSNSQSAINKLKEKIEQNESEVKNEEEQNNVEKENLNVEEAYAFFENQEEILNQNKIENQDLNKIDNNDLAQNLQNQTLKNDIAENITSTSEQ